MKRVKPDREVPAERAVTLRKEIVSALKYRPMTSRELSAELGISERDVLGHLPHVRRSLPKAFNMEPSACRKCGFVFRKRERLEKPGRCPVCRGESISHPLFSIKA